METTGDKFGTVLKELIDVYPPSFSPGCSSSIVPPCSFPPPVRHRPSLPAIILVILSSLLLRPGVAIASNKPTPAKASIVNGRPAFLEHSHWIDDKIGASVHSPQGKKLIEGSGTTDTTDFFPSDDLHLLSNLPQSIRALEEDSKPTIKRPEAIRTDWLTTSEPVFHIDKETRKLEEFVRVLTWEDQGRRRLDECLAVVIAGCEDTQEAAMGVYEVVDELCDGKPMYKKTDGNWLYYFSVYIAWFIGPTGCGSTTANIVGGDEADDPSLVTGWQCFDGRRGGFDNRDLTVTCTSWSVSWSLCYSPPPLIIAH